MCARSISSLPPSSVAIKTNYSGRKLRQGGQNSSLNGRSNLCLDMLSLHKLFLQDFTGRIPSKRTQKRLGSYLVLLPVTQSKKKSHHLYHSYPPSFNSLSTYQFKMIYSLLVCLPHVNMNSTKRRTLSRFFPSLATLMSFAFDKYLLNRWVRVPAAQSSLCLRTALWPCLKNLVPIKKNPNSLN